MQYQFHSTSGSADIVSSADKRLYKILYLSLFDMLGFTADIYATPTIFFSFGPAIGEL